MKRTYISLRLLPLTSKHIRVTIKQFWAVFFLISRIISLKTFMFDVMWLAPKNLTAEMISHELPQAFCCIGIIVWPNLPNQETHVPSKLFQLSQFHFKSIITLIIYCGHEFDINDHTEKQTCDFCRNKMHVKSDDCNLTVSQIWSFICLPSIVIIRAPNSTPVNKNEGRAWFMTHATA